jgi:hypothetical protein
MAVVGITKVKDCFDAFQFPASQQQTADPVDADIFEITPSMLFSRYSHIPIWAVVVFHEIKAARKAVPPEAHALLYIAIIPPLHF